MSVCADGASVMQGRLTGVVTKLREVVSRERQNNLQEIQNTRRLFTEFHPSYGFMAIHCICHRFALVVSDAMKLKVIPAESSVLLTEIHGYFDKSGIRKLNLKRIVNSVMAQTY